MQVELALNAPVAPAQLAHHVRTHAGAAKTQRFVGVQQGLDIEFIGQRLLHHGPVVELLLFGNRRRLGQHQHGLVTGPVFDRQGDDAADGMRKQVFFGARLGGCGLAFGLAGLLALHARLHLAPDELQVFKVPNQEAGRQYGRGRAHGFFYQWRWGKVALARRC